MIFRHKLVVFDLDDTLYLERDYVRGGFDAVGRWLEYEFGIREISTIAWNLFLAGRRGNIFNLAFEQIGVQSDAKLIQDSVRVYREHKPEITLLPDAEECIARTQTVVRTALITDGPIVSQKNKVEALNLKERISDIIYTEELGPEYRKPNLPAFRLIQEQQGFTGRECVYIADNPLKDFIGPHSLGWSTIRIVRPQGLYALAENGINENARLTVTSLIEALAQGII